MVIELKIVPGGTKIKNMIKLSEISKGDKVKLIHTIEDFGHHGDIVDVTETFKHAAKFKNPKNDQDLTCHAKFFTFLERIENG